MVLRLIFCEDAWFCDFKCGNLPQEQQRARAALALVATDVGLGDEARLAGVIALMDDSSGFGHSKRKA